MYRFLKTVWHDPLHTVYNAGEVVDLADWQPAHVKSALDAGLIALETIAVSANVDVLADENVSTSENVPTTARKRTVKQADSYVESDGGKIGKDCCT